MLSVLEDKNLNWIEILGYLCYHRTAGLAYNIINSINVRKLDYPVFFTLYMINQSQSIRTKIQKEHIKDISTKLRTSNIKHVFLKGSVLSNTIYPTGTRASNDIDILVPKKSIQKVKKILNKIGFTQGKYDFKKNLVKKFNQNTITQKTNSRGEMAPFVKIINQPATKTIDVDVNFSLDWTPYSSNKIVDYFLEKRVLVPIDHNFLIYSLNKEHLFIHLCNHLYKDSAVLDLVQKRKVLDLYKFVDIYTFIQNYFDQIDIEVIFNDSKKYSFDKYVFFVLNYTKDIFPEIMSIKNIKLLYQKYEYIDDNIMKIVFNQHNPEQKLKSSQDLIKKIFSYNIIKNYK